MVKFRKVHQPEFDIRLFVEIAQDPRRMVHIGFHIRGKAPPGTGIVQVRQRVFAGILESSPREQVIHGHPENPTRLRGGAADQRGLLQEHRFETVIMASDGGEHSLVIGTDYGHTDPSSELDAISVLHQYPNISQETKDRILHHNPKALYNL